jgi:hypothetical protein
VWTKQALAKIALGTEGAYVAYEGHSNFGLGFYFLGDGVPSSVEHIVDFMNVGEPLVRIDWSTLNGEGYALSIDYAEYGDEIASTELYDPWRKASTITGTKWPPYGCHRFYSTLQTGGSATHLHLTYHTAGTSQMNDYHEIVESGERLVVKGGAADMPTQRWSKLLLAGCNTGSYYLDQFKHGTVFYTVANYTEVTATKAFVKDIMDPTKDNAAIWSDLEAVQPDVFDYQTF